MDTLHRIAHDYEQPGPIVLSELAECSHDSRVNPLLIRLSQAHHQNAAMLLVAVASEPLVCRNEQPLLGLGKRPKVIVVHPLPFRPTDVENVMPESSEFANGDAWDVLVPPELSLSKYDIIQRSHLLLGQRGSIIEAGENVLARNRGKRAQEYVDAVSVRKHPNDLVNRNAGSGNTGLAVANPWVNRNSIVHGNTMSANCFRASGRNRLALIDDIRFLDEVKVDEGSRREEPSRKATGQKLIVDHSV